MTGRKNRFGYASQPEEQAVTAQPEVLAAPDEVPAPALPAVLSQNPQGGAADALVRPDAYALPPQRKGRRASEGETRRTDVPREQLNVRIRPELKRAAASLAGLQGLTLGDVVEAALIEYIRRTREGSSEGS